MIARIRSTLFLATLCFCILTQTVWAAPDSTVIENIRHHTSGDTVRIVFDLDEPVQYTAAQQDNLFSITVELEKTAVKQGVKQPVLAHPAVQAVRMVSVGNKTRVIIDSQLPVAYKVFSLVKPNRLVIDVTQIKEKKTEQEIAQGIRYTSWFKTGSTGPVNIHILDISPQSGYTLEPMLIKQDRLGIDSLSQVFLRSDILAAVNASYFAPSGDIIGLLKIGDEVISSTNIPRTALGITGDGKLLVDQVSYTGEIEFLDGIKLPLTGVNENRGENGLVLYNRFYGPTTRCNNYGMEYTVTSGIITAILPGNSPIPRDGYVVSAHGQAAGKLAGLKIGDPVTVRETLGPVWDQVPHVIGAGPMLVKQGDVFLTTKLEEFGNDVAGGRAPRTAVAITRDGHFLLVVVDGRQALSKGMTLLELALFLREQGAVNALNLDGGGSSEMIVNGRIVNKPSDGKERRIGNALVVVPTKLAI